MEISRLLGCPIPGTRLGLSRSSQALQRLMPGVSQTHSFSIGPLLVFDEQIPKSWPQFELQACDWVLFLQRIGSSPEDRVLPYKTTNEMLDWKGVLSFSVEHRISRLEGQTQILAQVTVLCLCPAYHETMLTLQFMIHDIPHLDRCQLDGHSSTHGGILLHVGPVQDWIAAWLPSSRGVSRLSGVYGCF